MSAFDQLGPLFIEAAIGAFASNKRLAERAVAQLSDDKLRVALDWTLDLCFTKDFACVTPAARPRAHGVAAPVRAAVGAP